MNGVLEMRKAVIDEIKSVYGCEDVDVDDVSMTAGCNMSFMAVIMTLAEAGDQVILPVPWYVITLLVSDLLHCMNRYFNHQ